MHQGEIGAEERNRDAGLVRAVGVTGLAAAIVNEVVGSGIFRLPSAMAASAGTAAPLAYVACLVAMGAVVCCFAEAGSRVPTSGGPYGSVEAAYGHNAGFVAGMLLWIASVLSCGGVAAALADAAGAAFPAFAAPLLRGLLIVVVLGAIAWINVQGVGLATRIISWATLAKLIPLFLFVIVGAYALATRPETAVVPPIPPGEGFGRAVILAMFALSGMETPLAASGEVDRPTRTIPRALLLAMGGVGLLYIAIQVVAEGLLGGALAQSAAPLADAIGTVGPGWRALLLAGAGFSMLCWLGSDILGAPRALFAFARDGLLPARLATIHPRFRTPHVAIWVHAGLAAALALTGTFVQLAVLSTLATSALYLMVCAAAWRLQRRGIAILGQPLSFRILPLLAVVGIASMLVLIGLAEWAEIAGLIAVVVVSATYVMYRHRSLPALGPWMVGIGLVALALSYIVFNKVTVFGFECYYVGPLSLQTTCISPTVYKALNVASIALVAGGLFQIFRSRRR